MREDAEMRGGYQMIGMDFSCRAVEEDKKHDQREQMLTRGNCNAWLFFHGFIWKTKGERKICLH